VGTMFIFVDFLSARDLLLNEQQVQRHTMEQAQYGESGVIFFFGHLKFS